MLLNLLTSSCKRLVISAHSGTKLALYDLNVYQKSSIDSFFRFSQYTEVPYEALIGIGVDNAIVWHNQQRYYVHGTVLDLSAIPKWEFGSIFGIVSYYSGYEDRITFRVIDLSALMRFFQAKDIIDAFALWRLEQADYVFCQLYGILIVISTKQTIQDNIYIELMNKQSRELSLHLAKVYYSSHQLLEEIYNSIIYAIDIKYGYQSIDSFVAMSASRSELNNFVSYLSVPYKINVYLSKFVDYKLKGKLDYSTTCCQGFGDLKIQSNCSTCYIQQPNTKLILDFDSDLQKQFTINWLISKTYTLE